MRSLLRFLVRNYFFLLFLVLELISITLIIRYNNYQNVKFFNSSNQVVARIYETFHAATSYFNLQQTNTELAVKNAILKNLLQQVIPDEVVPGIVSDSTTKNSIATPRIRYHYIPARVINNSVNRQNNYITLNKGRKDGVRPDMGIVGPQGIVGIITNVTDHYSTGPTLLNKRWRVSAKIRKNDYFGSLVWDGLNYRTARLNEIPFHVELAVGDTIVTSGYSSVFPEGILIGQIEDFNIGSGDNFYEINIRLSTNFSTLTYVEVIQDFDSDELNTLEKYYLDD